MAVAPQQIFDAINAQLETLPNAPAIAYLGVTYVPEATTPYLATSMPALRGKNITLGTSGVYEWVGIYQVQCNWPIGGGVEEVTSQMGDVMDLFPNGLSLVTADGHIVRFYAPDPKPLFQDQAWVRGVVQMPWFLHEVRN